MKSYSQIGQDLFVKSLIGEENKGYFIEIGGYLPTEINNTFLLEQMGWDGISFDIIDYTKEWGIRKTPLIIQNAVICDFSSIFSEFLVPSTVDYLSVDVEVEGERYKSLVNCWKAGREYKIITIEHDSHLGYSDTERMPQRNFLKSQGYFLIFGDVKNSEDTSYEDWWINPNYFDMVKMTKLSSEGERWTEILQKLKL